MNDHLHTEEDNEKIPTVVIYIEDGLLHTVCSNVEGLRLIYFNEHTQENDPDRADKAIELLKLYPTIY